MFRRVTYFRRLLKHLLNYAKRPECPHSDPGPSACAKSKVYVQKFQQQFFINLFQIPLNTFGNSAPVENQKKIEKSKELDTPVIMSDCRWMWLPLNINNFVRERLVVSRRMYSFILSHKAIYDNNNRLKKGTQRPSWMSFNLSSLPASHHMIYNIHYTYLLAVMVSYTPANRTIHGLS